MALRRLSRIEIGVREDALDATRAFHRDFGLHEIAAGRFATAEGGDALGRTSASLAKLGVECERDGDSLRTREPLTGARVALEKPRPTRLSHVATTSTDPEATRRFFVEGLGFRVSEEIPGFGAAFLRCSTDHHNVLVQPGPRGA